MRVHSGAIALAVMMTAGIVRAQDTDTGSRGRMHPLDVARAVQDRYCRMELLIHTRRHLTPGVTNKNRFAGSEQSSKNFLQELR